jgi:pSer/pThr/pTyr-binding forkhead associated (FHA) protein
MRAELVPLDGGSPIEVAKEMTLIGRKEDCDLCLDHKSVSKQHCIIVKTDGLLLLRDLGSTNGTRVNGQRVRRAALLPNDQLTVARYRFRVHLGPDDSRAGPEDPTAHMAPGELVKMLNKVEGPTETPQSPGTPWSNSLPDLYPADEP